MSETIETDVIAEGLLLAHIGDHSVIWYPFRTPHAVRIEANTKGIYSVRGTYRGDTCTDKLEVSLENIEYIVSKMVSEARDA